jgi:hypothetical protein
MKNLIIVLLLFTSVSFSQETYTFKNGGRVFENNERLNSIEVNKKFSSNSEILKLYNNGRNRKTAGNLLLWGGIGTGIIKFLSDTNQNVEQDNRGYIKVKQTSNVLYFVTGSMVLIAIPIKIGFQKKIKKSIILMNDEMKLQKQNTGINFESNIIANANGVGLKLTF